MEAAVSHLNKCERLFFRSRIVFIESLLKGVSRGNCSPQILYEALRINRKLVVLIRRTAGHTLVTEVYSALIHGTGRAGSRRLKRNVIAVGFSPVCPYKCAVRVLILCSRRDIQMIVSGRAADRTPWTHLPNKRDCCIHYRRKQQKPQKRTAGQPALRQRNEYSFSWV